MASARIQEVLSTRSLLVASSLVALGSFAGVIAISGAVRSGAIAEDWMGLLSLGLGGATVCGAIVSFIHAKRHDRNGPLWALGGFLFPYAAPLILAALPATGRVVVHGGKDEAALRSVLAGKWICPCGVIRSDARDGDTCDDCGKPMLRFHPAEKGHSCSLCSFRFSDSDVTTDDTMQGVWARKGFRCNACGQNVCMSCLPTSSEGELEFRCRCGGSVAIRV
jgi:hypothetical protein